MLTSNPPTYKFSLKQQGFSLLEILVALILAALVFIALPTGDDTQKHRDLKSALSDLDRSVRFAANESILRNTVVRLRISLEKTPIEYQVEYGPAGNLPLPDMPEKTNLSLDEEKAQMDKLSKLNKQFTKVEEFQDIKHELAPTVMVNGLASSFERKIIKENDASVYFYPTGEKDAAIIFLSTDDELGWIEIQPFLSENKTVFESLKTESVAKKEDILQTRIDEVYKEWLTH